MNPVGKTTVTYWNPTNYTIHSYQSASAFTTSKVMLDGFGRQSRTAIANGQSSNPWYQQDTCYDANGNVSFQSYRYQGNGWSTSKVCSGNGDTYSYDALGRVTTITHADGTSINYSYVGRATKITDENGVSRITQVDGLGRITRVCELSNSSLQGDSPSDCGTDIAGTGYVTTYSYDLANHKVTIQQGVQTRVFQTDWLGRPILVQEPERGTTTYSYAYNSTGLVVTRKRPKANQTNPSVLTTTTTQYDALGRVVSISYDDGTPNRTFNYDQATVWGINLQASKGHMTSANSPSAATVFAYDAMGRVTFMSECLPSGCGNGSYDKHLSYSYDWTGNLTQESDPASGNITYTRSSAGEVTSITNQTYSLTGASGSTTLLSNVQYGPNGPLTWQFGNGLTGARYYDALGRVSSGWVCNGSSQINCSGGTMLYGFDTSWRGSYLTSMCDSPLDLCTSNGYDPLGRLASVNSNAGQPTSFSYVYDRYGNRWQQNLTAGSGPTSALSFDKTTNRINSSGYSYDAAGNMTSDGFHSYAYDAEGNITAVDNGNTASYVYDALNHKVRVNNPAYNQTVEYVFDAAGRVTSSWVSPSSGNEGHIFWDGTQIAYRAANGWTYFVHRNWVASDRVHTNPSGASAATYVSFPFGDGGSAINSDSYASWDFNHFGDMDYNLESDTHHAQFRQYSAAQGRWMSPDPYDGSYDFSNPQSFNRYSYVGNNPLGFVDSLGLDEDEPLPPCPPFSQFTRGGFRPMDYGCDPGGGGICVVGDPPPMPDPPLPPPVPCDLYGCWSNPPTGSAGSGGNGSAGGQSGAPNNGIGAKPKPLSGWEKAGLIAGCLAGMDPEAATPINLSPMPGSPQDATDSPEKMRNGNGQKIIYGPSQGNKNGGLTPYNPAGSSSQTPENVTDGAGYIVNVVQCIENVFYAWPKQ